MSDGIAHERMDMFNLAILDEMKIDGEYPNPVAEYFDVSAELEGNELILTFKEVDDAR